MYKPERSTDDYIIEHQDKNTRAKTTRDVKDLFKRKERKEIRQVLLHLTLMIMRVF